MEKVIILGNGIAGLTAAIYTARASLSPLVLSGPEDGGQLTLTNEVENFPGFPEGVMGPQLIVNAKQQAEKFGAKFKTGIATKFEKKEDHYILTVDDKEQLETETLIIATGASARWMDIPSEEKFKGKGVSTCATCDGFFYKGKEIIIVGGGDSAMEEANFLTKFASKVTVVHRRDALRASKIMQDKFFKNPKTDILWNKVVEEVIGTEKGVTGVKLKDTVTGEISDFVCDGVFLALGHVPNTSIFKELLKVNDQGYLITDRFMKTDLEGVFAAGDVQDTRYRQAITAAGSGCQAAMEVEKYLESKETV
ncbi:thioredoxin-disulfide reductase [Candidatus Woesearchaeota archaeon CG10_big_fil_rev_8_21_14_0_10_32_9]|nr:MAG: thioredoxin-disulfide reductase [Candidatus Woesearchaeota archaeon CG10_big_fil_rev_8_21_14_0_10_32_9]